MTEMEAIKIMWIGAALVVLSILGSCFSRWWPEALKRRLEDK